MSFKSLLSSKSSILGGGTYGVTGGPKVDTSTGPDVNELVWSGTMLLLGATDALGVALEVAPAGGVGATFGAGVRGTFAFSSSFGFDINLVIRKENLAPWLALSHSMKLYEGK
jgi:hypothetical protein